MSDAGTTVVDGTTGGSLSASETSASPEATTAEVPTSTDVSTTGGERLDCAELDEQACREMRCDWIYGQPIDVEAGCADAAVFLACVADTFVCTGVPTVACADGAAVVFKGGCVPPGFVACDEAVPAKDCS